MRKIAMVFSGIILILGCLTLTIALFLSAVLPSTFLVSLAANPININHDILHPDMTALYIISTIKIILSLICMVLFGLKSKG